MVSQSRVRRLLASVWALFLPSLQWAWRTRVVLGVVSVASSVLPVALFAGVAGATCAATTVLCTATTSAKTTTLKYIGVALVGVVVVLALMIGVHVLIRLFHRVTGR